jgi:uncharacterized Zn-binding protein involved in type VI secretion
VVKNDLKINGNNNLKIEGVHITVHGHMCHADEGHGVADIAGIGEG